MLDLVVDLYWCDEKHLDSIRLLKDNLLFDVNDYADELCDVNDFL